MKARLFGVTTQRVVRSPGTLSLFSSSTFIRIFVLLMTPGPMSMRSSEPLSVFSPSVVEMAISAARPVLLVRIIRISHISPVTVAFLARALLISSVVIFFSHENPGELLQ